MGQMCGAQHSCAEAAPPGRGAYLPRTHPQRTRAGAPAGARPNERCAPAVGVATGTGVANGKAWVMGRRGRGRRGRGRRGRVRPAARPAPPELGAMGPGWRAASTALVGGSVVVFVGLRRLALALPRPAAVRSRPSRDWRWLNLLVSFAHSVLAGLWALFRYWAPGVGKGGRPRCTPCQRGARTQGTCGSPTSREGR